MADFDPYHEWLGISPENRPINYYSLFGLTCFESNIKAISNTADCKMAYIRTFQTGPHSNESQKILNELSQARVTLLNPEKKKEYDAQLRKEQQARHVPLPPPMPLLKQPEPVVQSVPKRPEPVVQSVPKRPEPVVQATPKRSEPTVQILPKRPEPVVHSALKRSEPVIQIAFQSSEMQATSIPVQRSRNLRFDSETIQKQSKSELNEVCQQILQVYFQKEQLVFMIEESKKKLAKFQFKWLGIPFIWHQIFPNEEYTKILQKLQKDIQYTKDLYEQCFLDISFHFTPQEAEQWNFLKNLIGEHSADVIPSSWSIAEEYYTTQYKAENGKYYVSQFNLKDCLMSVAHLDGFHSSEPHIFLGENRNHCIYIYPSFVIIINQGGCEILSTSDIQADISRCYLIADSIPFGIRTIDTVWKYAKKNGGRDLRYKDNEKRYILEYFKLEIHTESNQNLAFLFGKEYHAKRFAAVFKQHVEMSLLQLGNQKAFEEWKKHFKFSATNSSQQSCVKQGCWGCFVVFLILEFIGFCISLFE